MHKNPYKTEKMKIRKADFFLSFLLFNMHIEIDKKMVK